MAGINNDPFEEFEFKPINEGLGFHRKQKTSMKSSLSSNSETNRFEESLEADLTETLNSKSKKLDLSTSKSNEKIRFETKSNSKVQETKSSPLKKSVSFEPPLPRPETNKKSQVQIPTIEDDSISKAQTAVNDILKTLNQKRQLDFVQETEKKKITYKKSKPQIFASVLDGMLILSAFLLCLIIMLSVTKVDLFLNLSNPDTSYSIYVATVSLFLAVYFIYMVINRAFNGYTPGEWAFDQTCGQPEEMEQISYIPRLILRSIVVGFTGFVLLPFLSFLFNKDIAGEISGVALFQKPNA